MNTTPANPNGEPNKVVTSDQYRSFKNNTFTKIVTGLVVIVVIGGLFTYIHYHQASQPNNSPIYVSNDSNEVPFNTTATVSIQNQQVMPATIKVAPQTEVTFENHDAVDYHIESNQTIVNKPFDLAFNGKTYRYTEAAFANNIVLPASGGFNYVFAVPGTYYYHDVNNANINGEVIVN